MSGFRGSHRLRAPLAALAVIAAAGIAPAHAQTLMLQDNLPYTSPSAGTPGFMLEVIRAMEQVIGKKMPEKFMEWSTAQKLVRDGQDGMIFPFTRNAAREANYAWVLKFWDVQEAFYTKPGDTAPGSYDAAAKLPSVGVVGGASQDSLLTSKGFTNLQRFDNVQALAAAVAAGKVAAGYGPLIEVKYGWLQQKLPGRPAFGAIASVSGQWIAISKNSPNITPADWQQAFDVVQQDGTFDKLYTQYFGAKEE